jgi:hypothetical protein
MTGTNAEAPIPVGSFFGPTRSRLRHAGKGKRAAEAPIRSHIISLLLDATALAEGD